MGLEGKKKTRERLILVRDSESAPQTRRFESWLLRKYVEVGRVISEEEQVTS